MVWSSAQPHSVDDMVAKCFDGEVVSGGGGVLNSEEDSRPDEQELRVDEKRGRENLVAIWARDTLGLTRGEYNSKTQTTKDLTKPWAQLPLVPSSSQAPQNAQAHSAMTTLLLDDSSLKAHLQPYNHVCIREYVASLRGRDLEVFASERAMLDGGGKKRKRKAERKAKKVEKKAKARKTDGMTSAGGVVDKVDSDSGTSASSSIHPPSLAAQAQPEVLEQEPEAIGAEQAVGGEYDETLLAVIGVLDEVKEQSNVASWIRAGGLWGPMDLRPPQSKSASSSSVPGTEGIYTGNDASPFQDQAQNEDLTLAATAASDTQKSMWFDYEPTFTYWVRRGRGALDKLGINIVHGFIG